MGDSTRLIVLGAYITAVYLAVFALLLKRRRKRRREIIKYFYEDDEDEL